MGVSVIIASYNCEQYIDECLVSLFNQDYKGEVEIVVCDDCSTDGSFTILERYAKSGKIVLLKNPNNIGPALTRNKCLEKVTQDYIAIQDADDYSHPSRLTTLVECLEKNPTMDFVSSGLRCFYEDGSIKDIIPQKQFPGKKDFLFSLPFPHATTLFKKEVLKKVGGYDYFERAEDYYLFMKLYAAGFKGMNSKKLLYFYRCFKKTNHRDSYKNRINEAKVRRKGFKLLGLGMIRYLYVMKPLVLGLLPKKVQLFLRG